MAVSRGAFVVVVCLLCSAVADLSENDVERGMQMLYKTYQTCEDSGDLVSCLKVKAVRLADRALKINSIPLFEGLTVVRNDDAAAREMGVEEFNENALPEDDVKRDETLDNLLVERVLRFFKTHSVQFSLPKLMDGENDISEGRGKMKKYMGPMIMAAMMKGGMLALATKAVALLAAKAFLVAKIALVLASVIAVKKLFSSGGGESKTIEIVSKPQISHSHAYTPDFGSVGGGGGGWEASGHGGSSGGGYTRRSFDTSVPFPEAQELAYKGRAQQ